MRRKCNTRHDRIRHFCEIARFQFLAMIRQLTHPTNACLFKIDHLRKMAHGSEGFKSTTRSS